MVRGSTSVVCPGGAGEGRVDGRGAAGVLDPGDAPGSDEFVPTAVCSDWARIMARTSGSTSAAGSATCEPTDVDVFSGSVDGSAVEGSAVEDSLASSMELQAHSETETQTATSARADTTWSESAVPVKDVGLVTYDLAVSENLRNYVKTLYAMDAVVRRVPLGAWDNPSPCADWSGREALGHTIWGLENLTTRIASTEPPPEQPEAEVADVDPVASWTEAMDGMLATLDQQGVLRM